VIPCTITTHFLKLTVIGSLFTALNHPLAKDGVIDAILVSGAIAKFVLIHEANPVTCFYHQLGILTQEYLESDKFFKFDASIRRRRFL